MVWVDYGYGGSGSGVFGRRYDAAGAPRGGEFRVNSYTTDDQSIPVVASDPSGNFVVVWQSRDQDGSYDTFGQRYDARGVPAAGEFRLNTFTTNLQQHPSVASDGAGNFVATWTGYVQDGDASGIFAQRFIPEVIFRDGFEP